MSESNQNLKQVEREHIVRVLVDLKGNKRATARQLGIDVRTLYRKLERHGLMEKPPICPTCGAERG